VKASSRQPAEASFFEGEWDSHRLHATDRDWPETNCYVDLWVELLHAHRLEVEAMLGFTVAIDYEFDQWTFFKPRPSELYALYGVEVEELTIWKDLEEHVDCQVRAGRVPLVEVDAFHLPDTAGIDYQEGHSKTTIAVDAIDPPTERLHYLHNRGGFVLEGADYRGVLRIDPVPVTHDLTPFVEIAKFDRVVPREPKATREIARELLRGHLTRVPRENPIECYAAVVMSDLEALFGRAEDRFDPYAFASIRQCGAGFAFAADHVRWLGGDAGPWSEAADRFARISALASRLVLKMARIAHSSRPRDLSQSFEEMAEHWSRGMSALASAVEE